MSCHPSREICFLVLNRLYVRSGAEAAVAVKYWQNPEAEALSFQQIQSAVAWLTESRLLKLEPEIHVASLTPLGVASVERAQGSPESATDYFPALATFYGLGENDTMGVCRTTVRVWLDQLHCCSNALSIPRETPDGLEHRLSKLEHCVLNSAVDPKSLELGLRELKASL